MVDKLINAIDKEKSFREYKFDKAVTKQSVDLIDAVKIILEINELLKSDKVNND